MAVREHGIAAFAGSSEAELVAEASTLGWAVGEVPKYVHVHGPQNAWRSDYRLVEANALGFYYKLYAYDEVNAHPCNGPNLHTPRRLVVLND